MLALDAGTTLPGVMLISTIAVPPLSFLGTVFGEDFDPSAVDARRYRSDRIDVSIEIACAPGRRYLFGLTVAPHRDCDRLPALEARACYLFTAEARAHIGPSLELLGESGANFAIIPRHVAALVETQSRVKVAGLTHAAICRNCAIRMFNSSS